MTKFKTYLDLCRISNLPTIWTNVLAGCLLAVGSFAPMAYLTLALAMSLFYMAGMSFNDVCDEDFDRLHRPSRPIPAGRISRSRALGLTIGLFVTGMALLTLLPHPSGLVAGIILVLTIVGYDVDHKLNRFSVLMMAACRLLVFVVASLATTGELKTLVLAAGVAQFLYVLLISVVARHEGRRAKPYAMPVIPAMLAAISLLDGLVLALLLAPVWLLAGLAGALATWAGQKYVRGD